MMSWSLGALFGTEELLCTSPGCRLFLPIKMLLRTQPTANGFIKKAGRSTQGTFPAGRLSFAACPRSARCSYSARRTVLQELKPRSKLLGARPAAGLAVSGL